MLPGDIFVPGGPLGGRLLDGESPVVRSLAASLGRPPAKGMMIQR
jgi:hypothetical protein